MESYNNLIKNNVRRIDDAHFFNVQNIGKNYT